MEFKKSHRNLAVINSIVTILLIATIVWLATAEGKRMKAAKEVATTDPETNGGTTA